MKILLTGGAGFIGSHITDELIKEGWDVVIIDNLSTGRRENLNPKAKFYQIDIQSSDLEKIFKEEKPDYVNHHAAQVSVRNSVSDPVYDAQVNILGTLNLLENCVKQQVKKIIFASSGGAIYGEQEKFPADENHTANPLSPYGTAKLSAEHYLYYYKANYGLNYIALRYSNVYGPRQDPYGEAGVVAIFMNRIIKNMQPVINGDGKQTRDFVYVKDVVDANIKALNTGDGIFNIGTGVETSVNDLLGLIKDVSSAQIDEIYGPAKTGEQIRSVIDSSKADKVLGWEPQISLRDGLAKTFDYFSSPSSSRGRQADRGDL
ncbi:MAG: SDR family oxidoreductase [Actinobacteria bacterium]|nr:SDR family oxidoreductase [Actinomycetota bacterium]